MKYIKDFALYYDWDGNNFIERDDPLVPFNIPTNCIEYTKDDIETNNFLKKIQHL